jgi:hypothetical protein
MTYTYIGGGDYIHGVPARDLTEDEYIQHQDIIMANAAVTGVTMYVEETPWVITDDIDTVDTVQEE